VARAYKRGSGARQSPLEFDGFDVKQGQGGGYTTTANRDTAWLLSTAGVGADDDYYDYDEYDEGPPVPDEWDTMEPKYVNGKRVLINKQIE